ncbi:hypothetical protein P9272_27205 [Mesorhizobium sp. WSM4976]|uniref:hypothetical protein n=1 Tax=Mesorhizobium sp. WSM4976 TaxID=3038549 RepID=UPI0024174A31|nr:hypothetical protein [Mesorhizobium sp. WSM4976]MDG4897260.1 hypothetical protein [Mesorhizobium sp. WSM4976]
MGSPGFRAQNTATDLAISFQALRQSGADLTAVAVVAPQLSTPFLNPQKQPKTSTTAGASRPSA